VARATRSTPDHHKESKLLRRLAANAMPSVFAETTCCTELSGESRERIVASQRLRQSNSWCLLQ